MGTEFMLVVAGIIFALFILYLLSVNGRRGHPELSKLRGWNYAHRGLHRPGCPENSLAAFRNARDHGYGVELDVHLLADGHLAVVHDSPGSGPRFTFTAHDRIRWPH